MPVACIEFLAFAQGINKNGDEVAFRAAISRAYYGAFHACKIWHSDTLPCQGHDVGTKGGVHQILINQLTHPDASCGQELCLRSTSAGYMLRDLKVSRVIADYELEATVTREVLENALAKASLIIQKTQEPLPTPPSAAATIGLRRVQ